MNTQVLACYETAQETIGILIAARSSWVHKEIQKAAPNHSAIKQWRDEKRQFYHDL